jgi:hypothetical protein
MTKNKVDNVLKRLYPVALTIALFTGFGNMPIYKRYYISAIPGLEWSGNFYINLNIHYGCGVVLLGLAVYFSLIYLKTSTSTDRLTATGLLRAVFFGLSLLTGILLAIRNLAEINFDFGSQMIVVFMHLGTAMILLVLSIGCAVVSSPWRRKP